MKVAIVHYWLVNMRGGEKVLEALCELFPTAELFSHVYDAKAVSEEINRHVIRTSMIQRFPGARRYYQSYLPLMPLALEQLDLSGYDLVISSESGPAKGVIVGPNATHVCYCHSPMRYLWDMYHEYWRSAGWMKRVLMAPFAHYLRMWDVTSAARVDHFVANSNYVARRIEKYYRRAADVIYPPVDVDDFVVANTNQQFYLLLGHLVPYKRADVAIEAFNRSGRKLIVIGDGEIRRDLNKVAGKNIEFLGRQPFSVIREYLSRCRALIFPGVEDFGIVPVEAMASGRPVIAFKQGGVRETVVDGKTGLYFDEQTPAALNKAIEEFESSAHLFEPTAIRSHAQRFGKERFKAEISQFIESKLVGRR